MLLSVLTTLTARDDRVSPLVDVATAFDNVRLGVRGGSSGGISLTSLSLSDNTRRRLSGVSLSETVITCHRQEYSVFNKFNFWGSEHAGHCRSVVITYSRCLQSWPPTREAGQSSIPFTEEWNKHPNSQFHSIPFTEEWNKHPTWGGSPLSTGLLFLTWRWYFLAASSLLGFSWCKFPCSGKHKLIL